MLSQRFWQWNLLLVAIVCGAVALFLLSGYFYYENEYRAHYAHIKDRQLKAANYIRDFCQRKFDALTYEEEEMTYQTRTCHEKEDLLAIDPKSYAIERAIPLSVRGVIEMETMKIFGILFVFGSLGVMLLAIILYRKNKSVILPIFDSMLKKCKSD